MTAADSVEPVTVVICAYTEDRWGDLCDSVESVRSQTSPPLEILVVVDHNEDLLARARAVLPAQVLANRHTRGLSGARNTGIEDAKGSVIAFLDDDATARPDWLAVLQRAYRHPAVLGVGGSAHPVWPSDPPAFLSPEFHWVVGCTYVGLPVTAQPVRNPLGCNMSFRREVFDLVEPFTVGIGRVGARPVGCEETELCIRILAARPGGIILYDPDMAVDHRVTPDRLTLRYFLRRCYAEGLSKALVSGRVGAGPALSAERRYVTRTLPLAFLRAAAAVARGDRSGAPRAVGIVAGVLTTTAGYLAGRARGRFDTSPA